MKTGEAAGDAGGMTWRNKARESQAPGNFLLIESSVDR